MQCAQLIKTHLPDSFAARCHNLVKLKQMLARFFIKAPKSSWIIATSILRTLKVNCFQKTKFKSIKGLWNSKFPSFFIHVSMVSPLESLPHAVLHPWEPNSTAKLNLLLKFYQKGLVHLCADITDPFIVAFDILWLISFSTSLFFIRLWN